MNPSIASWRRQQRALLIAQRATLTSADRKQVAAAVAEKLDRLAIELRSTTIGLYWPIKNELNLISWGCALAQRTGATICLPVVVAPKAPLEFWRWAPGDTMQPGIWNIPTPAQRDVRTPDLVLAPLVGFDAGSYRLGYGGGYFDRTLAAQAPPPFAIGVGYDFCGLESIFPQPTDVAMNAILTECREMRSAAR